MLYKNVFEQLQKISDEINLIKDNLHKAYVLREKKEYEACLWMLRNTLELICKNIYANTQSFESNDLELRHIIKKLEENGIIPRSILPHIRTVQTFGNYGSHTEIKDVNVLNEKMIQPPIMSTEIIFSWFVNEYHCFREKKSDSLIHTLLSSNRF